MTKQTVVVSFITFSENAELLRAAGGAVGKPNAKGDVVAAFAGKSKAEALRRVENIFRPLVGSQWKQLIEGIEYDTY